MAFLQRWKKKLAVFVGNLLLSSFEPRFFRARELVQLLVATIQLTNKKIERAKKRSETRRGNFHEQCVDVIGSGKFQIPRKFAYIWKGRERSKIFDAEGFYRRMGPPRR